MPVKIKMLKVVSILIGKAIFVVGDMYMRGLVSC